MMTDNARALSLKAANDALEKLMDENDIQGENRRAVALGFLDGHKVGYRAAAGGAYVAIGAMMDTLRSDSSIEDVRAGLEALRQAIQGGAK